MCNMDLVATFDVKRKLSRHLYPGHDRPWVVVLGGEKERKSLIWTGIVMSGVACK